MVDVLSELCVPLLMGAKAAVPGTIANGISPKNEYQ